MSRVGPREPGAIVLTGTRSLADVLWLANTRHGPGAHWFARPGPRDPDHDHLAAGDAARYLTGHRVHVPDEAPSDEELVGLRAIVDMVRHLTAGGDWTAGCLDLRRRARYIVQDGVIRSSATGWTAWIEDALLPLAELVRHAAAGRVRACAGPACGLVFLDTSRGRTRRWCDDAGCGNRVRVRRTRADRVSSAG